MSGAGETNHRLSAVRRGDERVMPLELFFDLVFVLALTQCTALIVHDLTWTGVGEGLLVLAVLWWAWVGYAWLTSVVDPEEGLVRLVMFVAMGGMLVMALCVPEAFGDMGVTLAVAYAVVRTCHIALFTLASRDDPELRKSVTSLAISTAIGVALIGAAAFADGGLQAGLWIAAVAFDMGGPFLFGAEGWRIEPGHFAERHGLVMIIAFGESIVALGVGSEIGLDADVLVTTVFGLALIVAMWWAYFDVGALLTARALAALPRGKVQNEAARDAYSFLHFPMVGAVMLIAVGLEEALLHPNEHLHTIPAVALAGGASLYLISQVAFKWRMLGTIGSDRIIGGVALLALIPVVMEIDAIVAVAVVAGTMCAVVTYETLHYAALRDHARHHPDDEHDDLDGHHGHHG